VATPGSLVAVWRERFWRPRECRDGPAFMAADVTLAVARLFRVVETTVECFEGL
jgi:hypothetical protein